MRKFLLLIASSISVQLTLFVQIKGKINGMIKDAINKSFQSSTITFVKTNGSSLLFDLKKHHNKFNNNAAGIVLPRMNKTR